MVTQPTVVWYTRNNHQVVVHLFRQSWKQWDQMEEGEKVEEEEDRPNLASSCWSKKFHSFSFYATCDYVCVQVSTVLLLSLEKLIHFQFCVCVCSYLLLLLHPTGNERIILSSSPSYASTECAEELNDPDVDELKMDQMVIKIVVIIVVMIAYWLISNFFFV